MLNAQDRFFIERKYHDPEQPFNPFRRRAYHGIGYREDSGLDDAQLLAGLKALKPELEGLPHPIARAKAIAYMLENTRVYINEHDYFVGLYSLDRLADSVTFTKWANASKQLRDPALVCLSDTFNKCGAVMIWTDYDHVVPDWRSLMELGFPGILARSEAYREAHRKAGTLTGEADAFFEGIRLEYTAVLQLLDRMYQIASRETFPKAERIAISLSHLRDGAPQDFFDALQLIYVYFIVSECIDSYQVRSLGNGLDGTLYPFYQDALTKGLYTRQEMREFLSYFLFQWSAIGNYWGQPFYLGGTGETGESLYNELSLEILEVYDWLEIYNPKIQLKINENTPKWLLEKAFDLLRRKNASLVFCCEPGMIRAVMGYGATYEEARTMDIRGCYETGVRANEVCSTSGYVNAAKAVEYVFTNGYDRTVQAQVGLQTGSLQSMVSFEDFYRAFLRQWEHLIQKSMEITDDAERFLSYVNPSSLYSGTIEYSLNRGKDAYGGGVKFSNNGMLNCGFASAVDSILAVKEFVYDRQAISLAELAEVLENNWETQPLLRLKVQKSPHKYGNGDALADTYAQAMAAWFACRVNNKPNSHGGVYKAILHSARAFVVQGEKTGALPDGRLAGQELSKNASPVPGMDKSGVTALVRSAAGLDPTLYHESFCLDVMLHPSAVAGENGNAVLEGILMAYLRQNGQSIQFNIFNPETLRDAQKNPEKYKNLQVRVCGWNTLWNNMSRKEQDAYILRSENVQ